MSYLRYLCLLVHTGVQHILCCVFLFFLFVLCTIIPNEYFLDRIKMTLLAFHALNCTI
jgi:hypothetical protein